MRAWTEMTAADFYTGGTQLDMLAGIDGDGCGTLDLLEVAAEAVGDAVPLAAVRVPWAFVSPLFGDEQLLLGAA